MIKIAYVINCIAHTGPSNVLFDIIRGLDRNKYTPVIFTLKSELNSKNILQELEKQSVKVIPLFFKNIEMDFLTKKRSLELFRKINEFKPHLIHTHGYHPVLLISRMNLCNTIATVHNVYKKDFILSKGYIIGNYMIKRYSYCLNKIKNCVAVSETVKEMSLNKCSRVIYNGCNIEKFYTVNIKEKMNLRKKLNLSLSAKIYIIIMSYITLAIQSPFLIEDYFSPF